MSGKFPVAAIALAWLFNLPLKKQLIRARMNDKLTSLL
jgi:hypothetical protein